MRKGKQTRLDLVNGIFDKPTLLILLTLYYNGAMLKAEIRDTILSSFKEKYHQTVIDRRLFLLQKENMVKREDNYWKLTKKGMDIIKRLINTFGDLWNWLLNPLKGSRK